LKSILPRYVAFFLLISLPFVAVYCKKDPITPIIVVPPTPTDPPQYETPFTSIPATSDLVMYEINERAFSVSGTLAGILPRLDSIKALGVNVIWLMPIHPIGTTKTVNSPYCITNFQEVNSEYGTLEDLRTLTREAHTRNMAVVLDWVANHTSWDCPWIQNKAWYTQDANGNITPPAGTNWEDVADLNFNNADMRLEMIKSLKYWVLTANIDGYRCDAADYVPFSFWKQAIDSLKSIPNRKLILLAEGARADHFSAGFQMNFGWDFFTKNTQIFKNNQAANGFLQTHQTEYNGIPNGSQKLRFTSNHDKCAWEDTPLGFFGGKNASIAAFVITAYMGGVPLIYNGQEVGCAVKLPFFSRSPINWMTNPDMFSKYKKIMSIRAAQIALRSGDLKYYADANITAFKRTSGTSQVLTLVNTRSATKPFAIPTELQNSTWTDVISGFTIILGNSLDLGAFEYRILVK
jgi:Alpha amylase, catalytic domain